MLKNDYIIDYSESACPIQENPLIWQKYFLRYGDMATIASMMICSSHRRHQIWKSVFAALTFPSARTILLVMKETNKVSTREGTICTIDLQKGADDSWTNAGAASTRGCCWQGLRSRTFINKGLGYSQNRRVSGQRLCLLFSQISVFLVPMPLFLSTEIYAIL